MKKRLQQISALVLAMTLLLSLAPMVSAAGESVETKTVTSNLVHNGDFEEANGDKPASWTFTNPNHADITWNLDLTGGRNGSAAVHVSRATKTKSLSYITNANIEVQPSTEYVLEYWLKSQNVTNQGYVDIMLKQMQANGADADNAYYYRENYDQYGDTSWKKVIVPFTTSGNAAKINLSINFVADYANKYGSTGEYWIDDVCIRTKAEYEADTEQYAGMIEINVTPAIKGMANGHYTAATLSSNMTVGNEIFNDAANVFKAYVKDVHNIELAEGTGGIRLVLDSSLNADTYKLVCEGSELVIKASAAEGMNYALSSVLQMMAPAQDGKINFPICNLTDYPDSAYRGLFLESGVYEAEFPEVGNVKCELDRLLDFVDLCYLNKINYLHLNFGKDDFYALPSDAFPELSSEGAYTKEDLAIFNAYAKERGIMIIPEVNAPGHCSIMLLSYPEVFGSYYTEEYTENGRQVYGIMDCSEDAFAGLKKLYEEICNLFPNSTYIHLGGDEARITDWQYSQKTMAYAKEHGYVDSNGKLDNHALYTEFMYRTTSMMLELGRTPIVWEGFDTAGNDKISKDVLVEFWEWAWNDAEELIDAGFKITNASWQPLYIADDPPAWDYKEILKWNIYNWQHFWTESEAYGGKTIEASNSVIGGELPSWRDDPGSDNLFMDVQERLPALAHKTWNIRGNWSPVEFAESIEYNSEIIAKMTGFVFTDDDENTGDSGDTGDTGDNGQDTPSVSTHPLLDTSRPYNNTNALTDKWGVFAPELMYQGTWPAWEAGVNYGEIVQDGHNDAGALHLVSAPGKNTGVVINPKMVIGETYTLGLWVKGTSNSGKVLAMYANGDPVIIGGAENLTADWSYYELTFTAINTTCLQILAADWGVTDIYIDNITLKNSADVDLLDGLGNFDQESVEEEGPKSHPLLDTSRPYNNTNALTDKWGVFAPELMYHGTWPAWEYGVTYGEIVEEGNKDAGALHLVSAPGKNTGVVINPQMTIGETYTLGLWVKGTSNSGKVLAMYANGDPVVIGGAENLTADWSYYELTFTAINTTCLQILAADWGVTDIYIDNITLKNSAGVDLLEGLGDFEQDFIEEEEPEMNPLLDTSKPHNNSNAPKDKWGLFAPELAYGGTWPEWKVGVNYGEIVEEGNKDAGALHLVSAPGKNTGVVINAGMIPGETYTLGMWVKGTANTGKVLGLYNNGDLVLIGPDSELPSEWSYIEKTVTARISSLQMLAADWGNVDIYIDNVTLKNSEGVDLLTGYGDFRPAMLQWQLMLGEDIGVKFVSEIPEEEKEDVVVTITVNEQSTSYTANDMTYEDGKYSVLVNVAAAQMTDEIAVEVKVADVTVWNKTYTVRQYADYILSGDYDDATKALVKEMLSYGAAAQNYFDYRRNALATEGVDMFGTGPAEIPETAKDLAVNGKVTGLAFYGASLVFESKTAVRFYFNGDISGCSFTVNGNALEVKEKNNMHYVEVGQINPAELSNDVTITVTSGTESLSVTYSPMSYIVRMNGKATSSENLKVLLKAMYNYHLAATEI